MSRLIALTAGILVLGAMLAAMLMTNLYGDRGRGEIDLASIHQVPVGTGGVLTQPVPLQRPAPSAIEVPYRWLGSRPARIEVRLTGADGSVLLDTTEAMDNSRAPIWLLPTGDGSYWEHERAAFHSIPLPSTAGGTVVLRIARIDQEQGPLVFFISDVPSAPGSTPRPSTAELPGQFLDLETEYGGTKSALDKAPTFASRVQSLAPPWLPFPLPELLLALTIVVGIYLLAVTLSAPAGERPPEGVSRTRSR